MNARSAQITPVLNGFIVQIGCQTVVFDSPAALGAAVIEYYLDPEKTEKKYFANRVNVTGGPEAVPVGPSPRISDNLRNVDRNVREAVMAQGMGQALAGQCGNTAAPTRQ